MLITPDSVYTIKDVISDMASYWNQEVTPDDDVQRVFIVRLIDALGLNVEDFLND